GGLPGGRCPTPDLTGTDGARRRPHDGDAGVGTGPVADPDTGDVGDGAHGDGAGTPGSTSSAEVAPGDAVPDPAAHLVGDRPEPCRPLRGGDLFLGGHPPTPPGVALAAEEHDLGADVHSGGGVAVARPEVDEQLVHR